MTEIRIILAEERYADSLNRALDVVARERLPSRFTARLGWRYF